MSSQKSPNNSDVPIALEADEIIQAPFNARRLNIDDSEFSNAYKAAANLRLHRFTQLLHEISLDN